MDNTRVVKNGESVTADDLRQQAWKCYRQHAWDYFRHHACQRTTVFHFYLVVCALLTAAYFRTLGSPSTVGPRVVLGLAMVFLSFIFYKLDQRNAGMVEIGEKGLKALESSLVLEDLGGFPDDVCVFSIEEKQTADAEDQGEFWSLMKNHYGHRECFRLIFQVVAALGALGVIHAVLV